MWRGKECKRETEAPNCLERANIRSMGADADDVRVNASCKLPQLPSPPRLTPLSLLRLLSHSTTSGDMDHPLCINIENTCTLHEEIRRREGNEHREGL